jgi:hypothetical protein
MTTYRQNLLTWAWTMDIAFAVGAAALYISNWFFVLFFAWWLGCAPLFLKKITCSACGKAINMQQTSVLGLPYNAGPFRRNCAHCGSSLMEQVWR